MQLTIKRIIPAIVCTLLFLSISAQQVNRVYTVKYKDDSVGTMRLSLNQSGDEVHMKMVSDVCTRFVFSIHVQSEEEASFKSGRLIYSRAWRKVNGRQKVNNITRAYGNIYQTTCDDKKGSIQKLIDYNFLMLYTHEPLTVRTVYSDNFQQFVSIIKTAEHAYKIELPDGNYNYYFFSNGICNRVEVHHSFYTITMELNH